MLLEIRQEGQLSQLKIKEIKILFGVEMFWRPEDEHSALPPSNGSYDLNSGYIGLVAWLYLLSHFPSLSSFPSTYFTAELSLQPPFSPFPINHILMPDGVELVSDICQTNEIDHSAQ